MDRVKILLGNGIMTSEGDFWRRQRRMMQPSFHRRVIDRFSNLIREVNEKFAARWADKAARGEAVNFSDDTSELTLEIVLRSIFGSDLARLENAVRRQSVRGRRQGAEPRPEIRVPLPLADQAGRGADRAAPPRAARSISIS